MKEGDLEKLVKDIRKMNCQPCLLIGIVQTKEREPFIANTQCLGCYVTKELKVLKIPPGICFVCGERIFANTAREYYGETGYCKHAFKEECLQEQ